MIFVRFLPTRKVSKTEKEEKAIRWEYLPLMEP